MTDAERALEEMRKVNSPVTALKFFEKWGNYDGCILERALEALKAQEKPVEVTVKEFNDLIDPLMPSFNNIGNLFLNKFPNGVKVVDGGEHG